MSAVIHVSQKLYIMAGVLTLVFDDKFIPFLGSTGIEYITINGPTIPKVIIWLVMNMERTDPVQFKRIMKDLAESKK